MKFREVRIGCRHEVPLEEGSSRPLRYVVEVPLVSPTLGRGLKILTPRLTVLATLFIFFLAGHGWLSGAMGSAWGGSLVWCTSIEDLKGSDSAGARVTSLRNFRINFYRGGVDVVPGGGNIVPMGETALFKVQLVSHDPYFGKWHKLIWRRVHFYFYDSSGSLVYHERDTTDVEGYAQVGIPDVRRGKKISGIGCYRVEVRYGGNQGDMLYPNFRVAEVEFQ